MDAGQKVGVNVIVTRTEYSFTNGLQKVRNYFGLEDRVVRGQWRAQTPLGNELRYRRTALRSRVLQGEIL